MQCSTLYNNVYDSLYRRSRRGRLYNYKQPSDLLRSKDILVVQSRPSQCMSQLNLNSFYSCLKQPRQNRLLSTIYRQNKDRQLPVKFSFNTKQSFCFQLFKAIDNLTLLSLTMPRLVDSHYKLYYLESASQAGPSTLVMVLVSSGASITNC